MQIKQHAPVMADLLLYLYVLLSSFQEYKTILFAKLLQIRMFSPCLPIRNTAYKEYRLVHRAVEEPVTIVVTIGARGDFFCIEQVGIAVVV